MSLSKPQICLVFSLLAGLLGCGFQVKPSLAPPRTKPPAQASTSAGSEAASAGEASSVPAAPQTSDTPQANGTATVHATTTPVSAPVRPSAPDPPLLLAEETEHDFGVMDPFSVGKHTFRIQNVGAGPLRLLDHRSTCKCTVGEFPTQPILPGESAEIVVHWKTQDNQDRFEQSATVDTNDPEQPRLTFRISGNVLVHVGANPPELACSQVRPGTSTTTSTIISSQVWSELLITDIQTSLDGATWELAPVLSEELGALRAEGAQRLTVTLPSDLPVGPFTHWLRFRAAPADGSAPAKQFELPLTGKVLKPIAVYGQGVSHDGVISLGVIPADKGRRHRLIVKVYDPEPELTLERTDMQPSFVDVQFQPNPQLDRAKGVYFLDIIVPPSAPAARHQGPAAGELKLYFQHPRIQELALRIDFAVAQQLTGSP